MTTPLDTATDPEADDWLDEDWTAWTSLDPTGDTLGALPTEPGLYRVHHPATDELVYVGETGRSLRERVRALARGTYADVMPYRDPHTAAPCLWALRDRDGPGFEVSVTAPDTAVDDQHRKGLEAACIAIHRRETGTSPVANFGRIISGYEQSSYSKDGHRGGSLANGETEPNAAPGTGPLTWTSWTDTHADDWLGLDWTTPEPLGEAYQQVPTQPGVYRLWDPEADVLEYIGESKTLRDRLYRHRRNRDGRLRFSFAPLEDAGDAAHRRKEIETDLIGAHFLACGTAPLDQF